MSDRPRRVCLVSTGQPSTNPRLVKEADALVAAGYAVQAVGAFGGDWAIDADRSLLSSRQWSFDLVDWRRSARPLLFWKTRVRQRLLQSLVSWPRTPIGWAEAALSRPTPELTREALRRPADLYIAHNLGALPAAARAARRYGARLGFDAEDFHGGQFSAAVDSPMRRVVERIEEHYLPVCNSVTASSPGIAEAYRPLSRCGLPPCVLNVGSLAERASPTPPPASLAGPLTLYWFSQTIGPDRGLEDIVRAMGQARDVAIELHLRGTWAAGYEAVLRRLARDSGALADRIHAYPPAPPADMVRLAGRYDIGLALEPGVTPNNRLAVSNKMFTYLLAGTAVIATRTPGQEWLMRQIPDAGWLYDAGDIAGLVSHLRTCAADRARLAQARSAAWDYGTTRFNWEAEAGRFLRVVSSVLEDASRHEAGLDSQPLSAATGTRA